MNDRIKELANKAGYNDQIYEISKEGLDKFAELIVRECGNYMNSRIPGNLEVSATVAKMKQYFGVENV